MGGRFQLLSSPRQDANFTSRHNVGAIALTGPQQALDTLLVRLDKLATPGKLSATRHCLAREQS